MYAIAPSDRQGAFVLAAVKGEALSRRPDSARRERQDTPAAIDDLFRHRAAEPNSILDTLFEPQQLNRREVSHVVLRCLFERDCDETEADAYWRDPA